MDIKEKEIDEMKNWTATKIFIVPLLGIDHKTLISNGIVNAYIQDECKGVNYERAVYLLFHPVDKFRFEQFIDGERERKAKIIDEYDYEDGYIMLVYQYALEWNDDVKTILTGKYSKVSKKYQEFVPKTYKIQKMGVSRDAPSMQHSIIKRLPVYIEYWKNLYDIDINYKTEEAWHFYLERESFKGDNYGYG